MIRRKDKQLNIVDDKAFHRAIASLSSPPTFEFIWTVNNPLLISRFQRDILYPLCQRSSCATLLYGNIHSEFSDYHFNVTFFFVLVVLTTVEDAWKS